MDHSSEAHHHDHHADHQSPSLNQLSLAATLHCLTGCGIGEVLGFLIATSLDWSNFASIMLAVVLAFVFGYSLTLRPLLAAGMDTGMAARLAFAADTLSIIVMEIVDNAVMLVIPARWMPVRQTCSSGLVSPFLLRRPSSPPFP